MVVSHTGRHCWAVASPARAITTEGLRAIATRDVMGYLSCGGRNRLRTRSIAAKPLGANPPPARSARIRQRSRDGVPRLTQGPGGSFQIRGADEQEVGVEGGDGGDTDPRGRERRGERGDHT